MGDRWRVMLLAVGALGLIIAATFVRDWFVVNTSTAALGVDHLAIDLQSMHACSNAGTCGSVDMSKLRGMYSTLATVTLWTSLAFAVLVLAQAGSRALTGAASATVSRRGYLLGIAALVIAGATGFGFGPDPKSIQAMLLGVDIEVERTWTPILLMLGDLLGIVTLFLAARQPMGDNHLPYDPKAVTRVMLRKTALAEVEGTVEVDPESDIALPRTTVRVISLPLIEAEHRRQRPSTPKLDAAIPESCRDRLSYMTLTAEVARGGLDARREDGATLLVTWRDVVGVVARRLPPVFGGQTFVDIVSNAGATLRILPWTRLTGERPDGDDGDDGTTRARNLVKLIAGHCSQATLDRATRTFMESNEPAAQLPNLDTLTAHDRRLA